MNEKTNGRQTKLLAFDFDGTLVDSTYASISKVEKVLSKLGLPQVNPQFIVEHWGLPFKELAGVIVKKAGGNALHLDEFLRIEKGWPDNYPPADSRLLESLRTLKKRGYYLAIVSSRKRESLLTVAPSVGIDLRIFHFIQTACDSQYHKPDPRALGPVLRFAAEKELKAKDLIYFGDTVLFDCAAAVGCPEPIPFVGVVSGISKPSDFFKAGAQDVVMFPAGLGEYLQANFR